MNLREPHGEHRGDCSNIGHNGSEIAVKVVGTIRIGAVRDAPEFDERNGTEVAGCPCTGALPCDDESLCLRCDLGTTRLTDDILISTCDGAEVHVELELSGGYGGSARGQNVGVSLVPWNQRSTDLANIVLDRFRADDDVVMAHGGSQGPSGTGADEAGPSMKVQKALGADRELNLSEAADSDVEGETVEHDQG